VIKAAANPAPRQRLQRIAREIVDEEKFDHGVVPSPQRAGAIKAGGLQGRVRLESGREQPADKVVGRANAMPSLAVADT
jgi:hypothetical protein